MDGALVGSGCPAAWLMFTFGFGGRSNAALMMVELELDVEALKASPRRANAVQISNRFAPPYRTWSAWMIASRACMKVGLAGWSLSPSMTSQSALIFPALLVLL